MQQIEQSLVEQMQISTFEVEHRKQFLGFDPEDAACLRQSRGTIEDQVDHIVATFYEAQTSVPAIAMVIGDSETLARLKTAQRNYILDLFSGVYDLNYVNNRLRIGMVHKRIGVEPKLYLSAIHLLTESMKGAIRASDLSREDTAKTLAALEKLIFFDITLVFDMYVRSMVFEVQVEKDRSIEYAHNLESLVHERTKQLEELSRTDPLTQLRNRRDLMDDLALALKNAERRQECVSVAYFDIDNFKKLNDVRGHRCGDHVLEGVGDILNRICREQDSAYRYGGDEFCVILPGCSENDAWKLLSERFEAKIRERFPDVTVSIGIFTMGPNDFGSADDLLHEADVRMYAAKARRKSGSDGLAAQSSVATNDSAGVVDALK